MTDPLAMIRPRRAITGMSATLLPFRSDGPVDWAAFRAHVLRTADAGLIPAVNMDTGYVNFINHGTKTKVLAETKSLMGGHPFVAGAFVADMRGHQFDLDAYRRAIDEVQVYGGTPVIFQSYGLTSLQGDDLLDAYRHLGRDCPRYIGFELGPQFAPFGRIYDL